MVASVLKSVFLEIPNVTIWLVFQNQITYVVVIITTGSAKIYHQH